MKWEESYGFLPFVFVGSGIGSGIGMAGASFPRSAWECIGGRSASRAAGTAQAAFPRSAWER